MSKRPKAKRPSQVFASRLEALRLSKNLSILDLVRKLERDGETLDRFAVSKIEKGKRGVSVDEAVALAAALGVDPVRLLLPEDGHVEIAPKLVVRADDARSWLRGLKALPSQDETTFFEGSPDDLKLHRSGVLWLMEWVHKLAEATKRDDEDAQMLAMREIVSELDHVMSRLGFIDRMADQPQMAQALLRVAQHIVSQLQAGMGSRARTRRKRDG